jgi:multiple sugar transport system permease protein
MTARRGEILWGLFFVSPWLVGLVGLFGYPLVRSLQLSFCEYSILSPPRFVGWDNYADLLRNEQFAKAAANTAIFAAIAAPLSQVVAILIAVLLNRPTRWRGLCRTAIYAPALIPQIAVGAIWLWLLGAAGPVNTALEFLGFDHPPMWLTPKMAIVSLVFVSLWGVGNLVVIYQAGLADVPPDLYEAASLDGAGAWSVLLNVTLPMLSPVILYNMIVTLIMSINAFAVPTMLTEADNTKLGDSMLFYVMLLKREAFDHLRMGYASAMAWILFVAVLLLTLLIFRVMRGRIYYGGE